MKCDRVSLYPIPYTIDFGLVPIPDTSALVLWPGTEAGEGGVGTESHLAGLAHLAPGSSRGVGGSAPPARTAAHLPVQRNRVPELRQLVQLHRVQRHHQDAHHQQGTYHVWWPAARGLNEGSKVRYVGLKEDKVYRVS